MANVKISNLPPVTVISNGDVIPLVSGGVTTKAKMGHSGPYAVQYLNSNGNHLVGVDSNSSGNARQVIKAGAQEAIEIQNQDYSQTVAGTKLILGFIDPSGNTAIYYQGIRNGGDQFAPIIFNSAGGNTLFGTVTDASTGVIQSAGNISPSAHNTYNLGTTAVRWKDLWLQSGAFNGSDARLKTEIRPFSAKELEASKKLAREVGTYQWLESVKEKGDKARHHIGFTVQKAIQIMEDCGLNPFDYGFVGYDKWDDRFVHHEAVKAQAEVKAQDAVMDEAGKVVKEAIAYSPAVKAEKAWDELVLAAGDAFSFRYDQLNLFIARGFEARLSALEAGLS